MSPLPFFPFLPVFRGTLPLFFGHSVSEEKSISRRPFLCKKIVPCPRRGKISPLFFFPVVGRKSPTRAFESLSSKSSAMLCFPWAVTVAEPRLPGWLAFDGSLFFFLQDAAPVPLLPPLGKHGRFPPFPSRKRRGFFPFRWIGGFPGADLPRFACRRSVRNILLVFSFGGLFLWSKTLRIRK